MISPLSVQYPVRDCCLALGVSRSGYYQWKAAKAGVRALEQAELCQQMEKVFEQNGGRYGSPRLTRALREQGLSVSENRVTRLMRVQQPGGAKAARGHWGCAQYERGGQLL